MSDNFEMPAEDSDHEPRVPLAADALKLDADSQLQQFVSSDATSNHCSSPFSFIVTPLFLELSSSPTLRTDLLSSLFQMPGFVYVVVFSNFAFSFQLLNLFPELALPNAWLRRRRRPLNFRFRLVQLLNSFGSWHSVFVGFRLYLPVCIQAISLSTIFQDFFGFPRLSTFPRLSKILLLFVCF